MGTGALSAPASPEESEAWVCSHGAWTWHQQRREPHPRSLGCLFSFHLMFLLMLFSLFFKG